MPDASGGSFLYDVDNHLGSFPRQLSRTLRGLWGLRERRSRSRNPHTPLVGEARVGQAQLRSSRSVQSKEVMPQRMRELDTT